MSRGSTLASVSSADVETTALGAAVAAGLGSGVFGSLEDIPSAAGGTTRFDPLISPEARAAKLESWRAAVEGAPAELLSIERPAVASRSSMATRSCSPATWKKVPPARSRKSESVAARVSALPNSQLIVSRE